MSKDYKEQEYIISPINTKLLNYQVYVMSTTEKVLMTLVLLVLGGVIGLLFYGGLFKHDGAATTLTRISNIVVFVSVGLLADKLFKHTLIERKKNKRIDILKIQFRDFLAALSTSMSSGMNINDALNASYIDICSQYTKDSFIAIEVLEMINGLNNNIPIEESIKNFGERSGVEDIKNFGIVFSVCFRKGGSLKEIVSRTSTVISEKMMINEEIKTKITSNKLQMNMMLCIPIIMLVILRLTSSGFSEGFAKPVGVILLTISVGLFLAAFKVGQKIVNERG